MSNEEQEMLNYINEKLNDLNKKLNDTSEDINVIMETLGVLSSKQEKLLKILFEDDALDDGIFPFNDEEDEAVSVKDYMEGESEVCGSIGEKKNG